MNEVWLPSDPDQIAGKDLPSVVFPNGVPIKGEGILTDWQEVLVPIEVSWLELTMLLSIAELDHEFPIDPRVIQSLRKRVSFNEALGCWELPVYKDPKPRARYAQLKGREAHRVMWEQLLQLEIPKGLVLDHRCLNKACCYPRHLEQKTYAGNNKAAILDERHRAQLHFGILEDI